MQVVQGPGRGDAIAEIARAFALDRRTVRSWGRRGGDVPRATRPVVSRLDPYRGWPAQRTPEVGYSAVVLHRDVTEQGFGGSVIIVRRAVRALRRAATPSAAAVRCETAPGEQAHVDFAPVRVSIAEAPVAAQVFVMTRGYSRRFVAVAFGRPHLREWLAGHEQAFQHFGGVTDRDVIDNAKAMVLTHTRATIRSHPTYADFAGCDIAGTSFPSALVLGNRATPSGSNPGGVFGFRYCQRPLLPSRISLLLRIRPYPRQTLQESPVSERSYPR